MKNGTKIEAEEFFSRLVKWNFCLLLNWLFSHQTQTISFNEFIGQPLKFLKCQKLIFFKVFEISEKRNRFALFLLEKFLFRKINSNQQSSNILKWVACSFFSLIQSIPIFFYLSETWFEVLG